MRYLIPCPHTLFHEHGIESSPLVVTYYALAKTLDTLTDTEQPIVSDEFVAYIESVLDAMNKDAYIAHLEDMNGVLGAEATANAEQAVEFGVCLKDAMDMIGQLFAAMEKIKGLEGLKRTMETHKCPGWVNAGEVLELYGEFQAVRERLAASPITTLNDQD